MISSFPNNPPKVSVVMSVHNGQSYLAESIESVLNQTFTDFEFIIINDGSTDNTKNIIHNYKSSDRRIRVITNPEKIGLPKSLNTGIKKANGRLIARMDADDLSAANRLELQTDYLNNHPNISVIGGAVTIIGTKTKIFYPTSPSVLKFYSIFYNPVSHPAVMFKKESIVLIGMYSEEFQQTQDFELWSRMRTDFLFSNLPQIVLHHRIHRSSVSSQHKVCQVKNAITIAKRNCSKYGSGFSQKALDYRMNYFDTTFWMKEMFLSKDRSFFWKFVHVERYSIGEILLLACHLLFHKG